MKKRQWRKILKKIYGKPVPQCEHTDIDDLYCLDCGADLMGEIVSDEIEEAELRMENR